MRKLTQEENLGNDFIFYPFIHLTEWVEEQRQKGIIFMVKISLGSILPAPNTYIYKLLTQHLPGQYR